MGEVMDLDVEVEGLEASVTMDELQVDDVGVLCTEDARHGAEGAGNAAQDPRGPRTPAARPPAPGEVQPVGVNPTRKRVTADDVHLDLLVFPPEADNAVPGDRVTASGEMIGDAGG